MEWVETTGRTIEEAKDAALDELGVDEADAEFEVLEEPKSGLFGRLRAEARVRARVRPTRPRPKVERRDRRRRSSGRNGDAPAAAATDADADADEVTTAGPAEEAEPTGEAAPAPKRPSRGRGRRSGAEPGGRGGDPAPAGNDMPVLAGGHGDDDDDDEEAAVEQAGMTLDEQAGVAAEFLDGLLDAFGLDGSVEVETVDEETVELAVQGNDLGLLIGPRGQTLTAVQELARTVVQRQQATPPTGRLRVDIGGYRQRRRAALERFTVDVAAQVRESGVAKALEPMSPADRKVIHDTVNGIDGVGTRSEGEEPRRRVVIVPDGA